MFQAQTITVDQAIELHELDARARRLSPRTIELYQYHLARFSQWADTPSLADVTAAQLRVYLAAMQEQGLSPHTIHGAAVTPVDRSALATPAVKRQPARLPTFFMVLRSSLSVQIVAMSI